MENRYLCGQRAKKNALNQMAELERENLLLSKCK